MLERGSAKNLILTALSPSDRAAIGEFLRPVELKERTVLQHSNKPIESVHFIERGVVSQRISAAGSVLETAVVGFQGAVGASALFGGHISPCQSVVLFSGSAWRIGVDELRGVMSGRDGIHEILLRYIQALTMHSALTGLCCARHNLERRLACWLCLACDVNDSNVLSITHDHLSFILGLRRPSVTETLARFEEQGLISKMRGVLKVSDRELLGQRACSCYGTIAGAYASLSAPHAIHCGGEPHNVFA